MPVRKLMLAAVVCAVVFAAAALGNNVILLPGPSGTNPTVSAFRAEPFEALGSFSAAGGAFLVIPKPDGSRFYVIARNAAGTVVVTDASLTNVIQRIDLGVEASGAGLSPDGRRLIVLAGGMRIYDATQPNLVEITPSPAPDVGVNPVDVAFSHDSSRAFILSSASRRLTALNLATYAVAGSVDIPGISTAVVAAPNGLLYVSAQNRIYEVDGRTMTLRGNIPLNAMPGRMAVTPDGTRGLAVNQTPVTGSSILLFDLTNRSLLSAFPSFPPPGQLPPATDTVDKIVVVSNSRAFGFSSTTGRLFVITLSPFNVDEATFANLPPPNKFSGVTALAASDEQPAAAYLLVVAGGQVNRVNLMTNLLAGQLAVSPSPGEAVFAAPAGSGAAAGLIKFNDNQSVSPGGTSLPLVIRVLNAAGRPLVNVPVSFTTPTPGASLQSAMSATNAEGFASVTFVAPSASGLATVNASVAGGALTASFTLSVGTPGGGAGALQMVSGNGQVVQESFLTSEPLKVRAFDTAGNPVAGVTVIFSITAGTGTLNAGPDGTVAAGPASGIVVNMATNEDGFASVNFLSSGVPGGFSFVQATVNATYAGSSADFTVTTVLALLPGGAPAPLPTVTLIKPADRNIVGRAGQILPDAIRVAVAVSGGPQAGQPLPGVGVSVTTGLDPATGPTASCHGPGGTALTDASGIASCDLRVGGRIGTATLSVRTGGFNAQGPIQFQVLPGDPAVVEILQGDGQIGTPGQTLGQRLVARIRDAGGNLLPGTAVQWEVSPAGGATLSEVSTTADANGQVSARATLGNLAGPVQVRVRAGAAVGTFNLTVNIPISQMLKVSGDDQTAIINTAFARPLVVEVRNAQGSPVPGVPVSFTVMSGSATVGSPSAVTDSQGRASTSVTAGSSPGAVVVRAASGSFSVTFNLTVSPPGPIVTLTGVRNAISGDLGVTPGGIIAIYGDQIAPSIQGSVVGPNNLIGSLPTRLAGVEVRFGATPAPIYSVNNISGQQWVVVQAPWELAAPGTVSVTIRVGAGETVVNDVPVKPYQPGIFETLDEGGRRFAVLLNPDGSYVTRTNPARRGTRIRGFFGGLGQTNPATGTNRAGLPNQNVLANVVIGVNNEGVPVFLARMMEGVVGVYIVEFEVPANTAPGPDRPFAVAIFPGGGAPPIFGNPSEIPIQ